MRMGTQSIMEHFMLLLLLLLLCFVYAKQVDVGGGKCLHISMNKLVLMDIQEKSMSDALKL